MSLLFPVCSHHCFAHWFVGLHTRYMRHWCFLQCSNIKQLEEQMQLSLQNSYDRAGNVVRNADAEIARTRTIIASIDDLETEFAKIAHIREIVKQYRGRIEGLDQRLDQAARRRCWLLLRFHHSLPSLEKTIRKISPYNALEALAYWSYALFDRLLGGRTGFSHAHLPLSSSISLNNTTIIITHQEQRKEDGCIASISAFSQTLFHYNLRHTGRCCHNS